MSKYYKFFFFTEDEKFFKDERSSQKTEYILFYVIYIERKMFEDGNDFLVNFDEETTNNDSYEQSAEYGAKV